MCHKTEKQGSQLSIWQNSAHSKAFETLNTDTANQIAGAKGFNEPAAKTWECLKCHVTGYNLDATMLGKKFMKDRTLSIEKGLIVHDNLEDFCISCHNNESPTFVKFDFNEAWNKIKHDVPEEND
jgi:hypothetical protein